VDYETPSEVINDSSYALKVDLLERRPVILKSIYRRSVIEENGLRFLEGVSSSEDEIFDMAFIVRAGTISKIDDVVYLYTAAREGSITTRISLKVYRDLDQILPGLRDALIGYFGELVTSYRIAGLLRAFYFAKLRLLEPSEVEPALEICRRACDAYGFDSLLKTQDASDRKLLELLRDGNFAALTLRLADRSAVELRRRVTRERRSARRTRRRLKQTRRRLRSAEAVLERKPVALAVRLSELGRRSPRRRRQQPSWRKRVARTPEGGYKQESNGYWVFMDRIDKASDNAEALYRYVQDNAEHDRIAFVLDRESSDWVRLAADGFNLLAFDSPEHWETLYRAEFFLASHCDDPLLYPWARYGSRITKPLYRLVFLQHGIIRSDLSGWLGPKPFALFCTSSLTEYEGILGNLRYRSNPTVLQLTGLARHDLLDSTARPEHILIAPTWRSTLHDRSVEQLTQSEYFRAWSELLNSEWLPELLEEAGLTAKFVLHASMERFKKEFGSTSDRIQVLRHADVVSFADLISHSAAIITDYSSISFDVVYLRRPAVYYMFPESVAHDKNTSDDPGVYASIGDVVRTPAELQRTVQALSDNGWRVSAHAQEEIDRFFAYGDDRNRERIIHAVRGLGG
jgi:hypothetical protein